MKRLFTVISTALLAAPGIALAHPGHLAEGAHGHDHYLALTILGVFVLALLTAGAYWLWRKAGSLRLLRHHR